MRFLFIDESERQQKSENQKLFFCLCGLMVDDNNLLGLENSLKGLRNKYGLSNFKDSRKKFPFKFEITTELYEILKLNNIQIMSSILGNIALRDTNIFNAYFDALYFLIETHLRQIQTKTPIGQAPHV